MFPIITEQEYEFLRLRIRREITELEWIKRMFAEDQQLAVRIASKIEGLEWTIHNILIPMVPNEISAKDHLINPILST